MRRFTITVKDGLQVVATVPGRPGAGDHISIGDLAVKVVETEQFLERLTGFRFHIEMEH